MPDGTNNATPDRVREIEMQLFQEIGAQIKGMADSMRQFQADFGADLRDVRERLIRIEAQDQPGKIAKLEDGLAKAHDEIARVQREGEASLAAAMANAVAERAKIVADAVADRAKIVADHAGDKLVLEKRLTRMETIVAPIMALGAAVITEVVNGLGSVVLTHVH